MVCDERLTGILHCRGQALRSCYTRREAHLPLDGERRRHLRKRRSREAQAGPDGHLCRADVGM